MSLMYSKSFYINCLNFNISSIFKVMREKKKKLKSSCIAVVFGGARRYRTNPNSNEVVFPVSKRTKVTKRIPPSKMAHINSSPEAKVSKNPVAKRHCQKNPDLFQATVQVHCVE